MGSDTRTFLRGEVADPQAHLRIPDQLTEPAVALQAHSRSSDGRPSHVRVSVAVAVRQFEKFDVAILVGEEQGGESSVVA